ncbi:hypothetical protein F4808DRAFT_473096 [Astrocystis sublimbata]|nr:hypothetical protein F4808DRAFT_473096 [Astrocystis sublimbata]
MSAINAPKTANEMRERGNAFYKKGALKEAIAAYEKAAALDPADPLPLSNLSAAHFETGSYTDSVEAAQKALEKPQFVADTKSPIAQKLLVRSAKSRLHLAEVEEAKGLVDKILPGKELDGLVFALKEAGGPGSARDPELREKLLRLPRIRPSIQDVPDYFGPGHDKAESLYTSELHSSCGDEATIHDYYKMRKNPSQKVHFTILDHKPSVLARVLIFFSLMQEGMDVATDTYIFCTSLMPAEAAAKFHDAAERIRAKLQNEESPFKWLHIPTAQMKPLETIISQWKEVSKTMYPTAEVRREIALALCDAPTRNDVGDYLSMPECELEHRFFEEFSVVLPPREYLKKTDPELAELVSEYRNGYRKDLRQKIGRHLDTHWSGPPDFGFDPFSIIGALREGGTLLKRNRVKDLEAMTVVTKFFGPVVEVLHRLQDEVMIEAMAGDMMDVQERIRYDRLQRPSATSPKEYHVIHLSNIPDYIGGTLTSFMYAVPLLKQGTGTGLTANVLRNPPRWKGVDQFNAEHLLMHDRDLIKRHFALKFSRLTPEFLPQDMFSSMSLTMTDYKMWESVGWRPLALTERMSRENLFRWLYSHFLKLCLPFPRAVPDFTLVYAPLNMTAFMRLLGLVVELGYPSHWISALVSAIASGEITTTARAPRKYVMTSGAVDRTHDAKTICVRAWADEFTTLAAMWRGVWPAGTLVLARDLLPSPSRISEYSIRFPDFAGHDLNYPHFALVFWNQRRYGEPVRNNLRPILLDDEKGVTTEIARLIRADGVKVVSTFSWARKTNTAAFWLGKDAVDEMTANGWFVYIWRVDTWGRLTVGTPLDGAITCKESFVS